MEEEEDEYQRLLSTIAGGVAFLTAFALILSAFSYLLERFIL